MKILFIGNSYTFYNDLPRLLQALAGENGQPVSYEEVLCGGRHLYEYLDRPDEYKAKLDDLISTQAFDLAILQDHSLRAMIEPVRFHDAVRRMMAKFGDRVGKVLLYATWGRAEGSETLAHHGWTREGMTETIAREYAACAAENGINVSPVGECFLKAGQICPAIQLYNPDLTHPSYEGSCLAAMMHYKRIFGSLPTQTASLKLPEDTDLLFRQVVDSF